MLQDMDEKPEEEEDSIMGTPANAEDDVNDEIDDAEYSRIFDEDTLILNQDERLVNSTDKQTWKHQYFF